MSSLSIEVWAFSEHNLPELSVSFGIDLAEGVEFSANRFNFSPVPSTFFKGGNTAGQPETANSGDSGAFSEKETDPETSHHPVSAPAHYTWLPGIECKHVTEHFNFNLGAAIKYLWRAGRKGNKKDHLNDLKKAMQRIKSEHERVQAFE